jgi:hypothetical protein
MTKKSEAFEQQIHRLHELVEGNDAEVTWNDHIPDPDNPAQPRQIDITIKRGDDLTLVECRLHMERTVEQQHDEVAVAIAPSCLNEDAARVLLPALVILP